MKILRAFMLVVLVTICAVTAVVVISYLGGGSDTDGAQPRDRMSRNNASSDLSDNIFNIPRGYIQSDLNEEFRYWQRLTTKSEETGLWKYYPVLPYDVLPGEIAVLSVSVVGFKGWEVDLDYAWVELFDEVIEGENAYVSFIMPEKEASILALYDEYPYINYENQIALYMMSDSFREQGEVPGTGSSSSLTPEIGSDTNLFAVQGLFIDFRFMIPESLPDDRIYKGEVEWIPPPDGLGRAPGMDWRPSDSFDTPDFGVLRGTPSIEEEYPFDFIILQSMDGGTTWTERLVLRYNLIVLGPNPRPMILTPFLPDAMIGTPYRATINTLYFDTQGFSLNPIWMEEDVNLILKNAGLEMRSTAPFTSAVIFGTPTDELGSLTGGNIPAGGSTYDFDVRIRITGFADLLKNFEITVWPQPSITPPRWADGMENQLYNPTFPAPATSDVFVVTDANDLLNEFPDMWGWERSGDDLPDGLFFGLVDPDDLTRVAIFGTPNESTAGVYRITLIFKSINRNLIQGDIDPVTFEIRIWPRPEIKDWNVHGGKLPDGMVGPGSNTSTNPYDKPPDPFMASPTVTWSVAQPEPDEVYAPIMGTIKTFNGAVIEASIPDGLGITVTAGVPQIIWSSWTGTKPAQTSVPLPTRVIPDSELFYSSNIGQTLSITGKTTDETKADDYKLNIGFSITHPNPNINGARTDETFDLRIWRRAYLSVIMQQSGTQWTMAGNVSRSGTMEYREYARAVIPGQWGTIQSIQTGSNFIRWEVLEPNPIPREVLSPGASLTNWPAIGGNWELTPPGATAMGWVNIRMPIPASPTADPINVIINGWHSTAPTVIGSWDSGEKDKIFTGSFIITNFSPAILGGGPLVTEEWGRSNINSDTFPAGVNIIPNSGTLWGPPTETVAGEFPKTFNFHVDLTLKGSMRLTYGYDPTGRGMGLVRNDGTPSVPFSLYVDIFRPDYGDFDGDGRLDLADLVLLTRWVYGSPLEKANAEADMRLRDGWRNSIIPKDDPAQFPDGRDLLELERWFALDGRYVNWVPPSN